MSWKDHSNESLISLLQNMVAEGLLARQLGVDVSAEQVVNASKEMLMETILVSMPLAHIMDTSDIVFHAHGPSVRNDALSLSAVNWLTQSAERAIRRLSGSLFDLSDGDAKRLARSLNLRLTGFAPGSLYAGVAIIGPDTDLLTHEEDSVIAEVRSAIRTLPEVPRVIHGDIIGAEIRDLLPDPAKRDASLSALLQLSPTGKKGIHTLGLSSPGSGGSSLGQRERVVIKDAVDRPRLQDRKEGTFAGELREIDLDSHRFHLRNVRGIGGIRCIVGQLDRLQGKSLLGEYVRVSGEYESDASGKPRLMIVNHIELLPSARQDSLL